MNNNSKNELENEMREILREYNIKIREIKQGRKLENPISKYYTYKFIKINNRYQRISKISNKFKRFFN